MFAFYEKGNHMLTKKITCKYTNSEEIIEQYINTANRQNEIPIIGVMIMGILLGVYGLMTNPGSHMNYIWLGIVALMAFGEIFSSRRMVTKRQINRYKKKYGRVNNKIEITLSDKVHYSIDGYRMDYKWHSIVEIKETDDLLILCYPSEMIPLKKEGIKNVTLDDTREFIKDHIAIDKAMYKEKKKKKSIYKSIKGMQRHRVVE